MRYYVVMRLFKFSDIQPSNALLPLTCDFSGVGDRYLPVYEDYDEALRVAGDNNRIMLLETTDIAEMPDNKKLMSCRHDIGIEINKIYNEDCRDTMARMPDDFIDLIVTSPPYDNLRDYTGEVQWNEDVWKAVIKALFRVTKQGGVVVWIVGDATIGGSETGTSFRQALWAKECGFNLHDTMIYEKINYVPLTHNRYEQAFEFMFIFGKGKPKTFNPLMVPCKNAGKSEKYGLERRQNHGKNHSMRLHNETTFIPTKEYKISQNIFSYTIGKEKTGHPAPFPERLANDHIITWSNKGDLVYDPFMGSGTTAKMAIRNHRKCIGSEISKEYCDIALTRIENAQK